MAISRKYESQPVEMAAWKEEHGRQAQLEELTALYEVSLVINQTLNLEELLSQVLETITGLKLFRVLKKGGIFIVEGDDLKLVSYLGAGHSREFLDLHTELKRGECLCGVAAETGEVVVSSDCFEDPRHTISYPQMTAHGHIVVPLKARGKVVGVMYLYVPADAEVSERSVRLLTLVGDQLGIAIENARLYQGELESREKIKGYANRLSVLHRVGLSISTESDQGKLADLILTSAGELTRAKFGILAVLKNGRPAVASSYAGPWSQESPPIHVPQFQLDGEFARLMRTAHGNAFFTEAKTAARWFPETSDESNLLIGVLSEVPGRITGFLMLAGKADENKFSEEDKKIVSLLAAQSSAAMMNASNLAAEHQVAEMLESTLLTEVPETEDMEIGLVYQSAGPLGRVGGDFYDFVNLDSGRMAVIVGDTCGKGLENTTYTAMVKYMLRAYLADGKGPGECLTLLNRSLCKEIQEEKFITLCLLILDKKSSSLTYSCAGHPPPLVSYSGRSARCLRTNVGVPLGVDPNSAYPALRARVNDVAMILLYTDGLSEARNKEGSFFGVQGIAQSIYSHVSSTQSLAEKIVAAAADHSDGDLQDDMTLLVLKLSKND